MILSHLRSRVCPASRWGNRGEKEALSSFSSCLIGSTPFLVLLCTSIPREQQIIKQIITDSPLPTSLTSLASLLGPSCIFPILSQASAGHARSAPPRLVARPYSPPVSPPRAPARCLSPVSRKASCPTRIRIRIQRLGRSTRPPRQPGHRLGSVGFGGLPPDRIGRFIAHDSPAPTLEAAVDRCPAPGCRASTLVALPCRLYPAVEIQEPSGASLVRCFAPFSLWRVTRAAKRNPRLSACPSTAESHRLP